MLLVIVAAVLGLVCVLLLALFIVTKNKLGSLKKRYSTISNADEEAARIVTAARKEAADEAASIVATAKAKLRSSEDEAERTLSEARKKNIAADEEAARLAVVAKTKMVEAEDAAARLLAEAQRTAGQLRDEHRNQIQRRDALTADYVKAKETYDRLVREVQQVEENLEDISFGLYKPHYKFDTPEDFKTEFDKVRDRQKEMIRAGTAASFSVTWTVGGSEREGAKMQKQYVKLLLRAFNGECDAAVAKVVWNNATKMEERIEKAFEAINDLGEVMKVSISREYRKLKIAELHLEHELEEKKRAIAEEQRRIREQMREEERAQREAEKAQEEAEAEEVRFQKALDKARVELAKSKGEEHQRLTNKLLDLEQKLAEAHAKSVRAKSLAQLTKAGYVYVLSNVGSFGDEVYKIGMTRRLDPMDRVKELGDASVPFPFDVHAMVYSENAPALENQFHQHFAQQSVNLVNMRKEFFKVSLQEVEKFALDRNLKISFTKLAEAREYRETLELRRNKATNSGPQRKPPPSPPSLGPA